MNDKLINNKVVCEIREHLEQVYNAETVLNMQSIPGSVIIAPRFSKRRVFNTDADYTRNEEDYFIREDAIGLIEIIYHPEHQRIDFVRPVDAEITPMGRQPVVHAEYLTVRGGTWKSRFKTMLCGIITELWEVMLKPANVAAWVIAESDIFDVNHVVINRHHARVYVGIDEYPELDAFGCIEIFYNNERSAFARIKNKNGYQTTVLQSESDSIELGKVIRDWMQTPYRNGIIVAGREPDYEFVVQSEKAFERLWPEFIEAKEFHVVLVDTHLSIENDQFGHAKKFMKGGSRQKETYLLAKMDMTKADLHRWSADDANP